MKKYFLIFLLAISLSFSFHVVFAQADLTQDIAGKAYGQVGASSLSETAGKIIKIVLGLVGTIFLVLTIYAGFLWMTAAGNEEQATKAIGILKTAVIGLVIILASYSITYFILDSVFKATT
jgi:hypothetical protein